MSPPRTAREPGASKEAIRKADPVLLEPMMALEVTVPEDYYDRFHGYASSEPPNYPAACNVLVEAAGGETVMTTALDTRRGDE